MVVAGALRVPANPSPIFDHIFEVDQQKALSPKGGRFFVVT